METGFYPARGTPSQVQPQPTGHTSDGSGLQNHSIGGIFPRVAVYYPFTRTWRIMEANGTYSKEFSSYYEAIESVIQ